MGLTVVENLQMLIGHKTAESSKYRTAPFQKLANARYQRLVRGIQFREDQEIVAAPVACL
jgi:hypothetical protein